MWRSIVLSFTLQLTAVALGVVVSILTVDKLGAFSLGQPMPPIPRAPRAVQVVAVERGAASPSAPRIPTTWRPIVVPTRIPAGIPLIEDVMSAGPAPMTTGVQGIPDGVSDSMAPKTVPPLPPPPPPPAATPAARQPVQTVRVGGDVLEAKLVKRVMPVYPALAKQMRLSGVVRLEGVITRDGRVSNLRVASGHPMLAAAAVEAVRQWVYQPTLLNGEPVEVIAPIDVRFILSQ